MTAPTAPSAIATPKTDDLCEDQKRRGDLDEWITLARQLERELAEGHRICDDLLRVNKELRASLADTEQARDRWQSQYEERDLEYLELAKRSSTREPRAWGVESEYEEHGVTVQSILLFDTEERAVHYQKNSGGKVIALYTAPALSPTTGEQAELTFTAFRRANAARCSKWHPAGITSWSPSDWLTAVTGELGELASLLKMRNRERDGLPGNKFSPTDKQVADELADVLTYLDLLAEALGVDLGRAAVEKFNEVSERVGFPDRITLALQPTTGLTDENLRVLARKHAKEMDCSVEDIVYRALACLAETALTTRLRDALSGMVGLVQLVQERYPDFPVDNHRVIEALSALKEAE